MQQVIFFSTGATALIPLHSVIRSHHKETPSPLHEAKEMPKEKEMCRQGSNAGLLQRNGNPPKHQATAADRNGTALSGISNSGMTLEPSKKIDVFFYIAKMIVIITEKATLEC